MGLGIMALFWPARSPLGAFWGWGWYVYYPQGVKWLTGVFFEENVILGGHFSEKNRCSLVLKTAREKAEGEDGIPFGKQENKGSGVGRKKSRTCAKKSRTCKK